MVDPITGEIIELQTKKILDETLLSNGDSTNKTVAYEVVAKIPVKADDLNNVITPFFVEGGYTELDATATLYINYDLSGDKEQIRINRVYGSWVSSSPYIHISDREVFYGDGVPLFGKSAAKYPSTNSFSYNTGWGWVDFYPAVPEAFSGPRAFSYAMISAPSMGSFNKHPIEVFVTINK